MWPRWLLPGDGVDLVALVELIDAVFIWGPDSTKSYFSRCGRRYSWEGYFGSDFGVLSSFEADYDMGSGYRVY